MKIKREIYKSLFLILPMLMFFAPFSESRTIDVGTAYKTRGELGVGYNSSDTVQNLTLAFRTWNGEWTPVEVFFRKGYTADGSNGSGIYNITNLQIDGGNYADGFDNYQRCILNLEAGTKLNMSAYGNISGALYSTDADITMTYLDLNAYGIFNMQGGKLSFTGGTTNISYKIAGKMTLNNVEFSANYKVVIDGGNYGASEDNNYEGYIINDANVVFSGTTSFNGTALIVEDTNKLSLLDNSVVNVGTLSASNLKISSDSKITVSSAENLSVENLDIILNELTPLDFSEIFNSEDGDTIVFSAENTKISVHDINGTVYDNVVFSYDADGNITGISAIPEPSMYAAILGVFIIGITAYRRRK